MPSYKLIYFNIRGRAELTRLIFAQSGVEYVDERVEFKDWPEKKKEMPFGQMPVLMINDKPLPQSGAIVRYLADKYNLAGQNGEEAAFCDMIVQTLGEVLEKLPVLEKDEKKKAELLKKALTENICPFFTKVESKFSQKIAKAGKDQYLVGSKLTYADIAIMHSMEELDGLQEGFSKSYPNLCGLRNRVKEEPKIKAWMEKRPKTQL